MTTLVTPKQVRKGQRFHVGGRPQAAPAYEATADAFYPQFGECTGYTIEATDLTTGKAVAFHNLHYSAPVYIHA